MLVLYNVDSGNSYDITQLTGDKSWAGSITQPARTLTFSFLMNQGADIEVGDIISYTLKDSLIFKGVVTSRSREYLGKRSIKCSDFMYYWARNRDTFSFTNQRASDMIRSIAKRFQLELGSIANTSYVIPAQVNPDHKLWDIIKMALDTTFKQTHRRFHLRDIGGKATLIEPSAQTEVLEIVEGQNLLNYNYDENMDDLYNIVKVISQDEKQTWSEEKRNSKLIKKFGMLQHLEKVDSKTTQGQARDRAAVLLDEHGRLKKSLSIEVLGDIHVWSGDRIYVSIPSLGLRKPYYVESDNHSIKSNSHTMKLTLTDYSIGGIR